MTILGATVVAVVVTLGATVGDDDCSGVGSCRAGDHVGDLGTAAVHRARWLRRRDRAALDPPVASHADRDRRVPVGHHRWTGGQHARRRSVPRSHMDDRARRYVGHRQGGAAGATGAAVAGPRRTAARRPGAFNLVEGLVDHHLLRVHHVRDDVGSPLSWDLGFLAVSAVLVAVGPGMSRPAFKQRRSSSPTGS